MTSLPRREAFRGKLSPRDGATLRQLACRRARGDPLREFTPTVKQAEFIAAVTGGAYPECFFLAANRAGKTKVGSYLGALFARFGLPWARGVPTSGWVVALDFPMSRDVLQPYYFKESVGAEPFIPSHEIRNFDRQSQVLYLKNGSQIAFKSCESGPQKFQAAGKDWIAKDEVIPKAIDDEIAMRVKAGARLLTWTTATLLPPEGRGGDTHWLYTEVVKPWKQGSRSKWVTNASIYDNPHLLREEIARLEGRYPAGSLLRRIRLDGELLPGISGSVVYSAFSPATHVRSDLELDEHYPVLWAWDFNVSPLVSLIAQRKEGRISVVRELWMEEGSIPEMCDLFRQGIAPRYPIWLYGDASGRARTAQTRSSSYTLIANELTSRGYRVKMQLPEANPSVSDRINAVNQCLASHEGRASLVVASRCGELITDLETVVYDRNNGIKKITSAVDPYRWRTHLSDALGYLVHREMPVMAVRPAGRLLTPIRRASYG